MARIRSNPLRSSTLPTNTPKAPQTSTPPRASTLPTSTPTARPTTPATTSPATRPTTPGATSPAGRPTTPGATTPGATLTPGATNTPAAPNAGAPVKHPGAPAGGPTYSPWSQTTGAAGDVAVSGGDNKLTAPPMAQPNMYLDKTGRPFAKDAFGGTVSGNSTGSAQASTTAYSGNGQHHYSAQTEIQGPSASYQAQGAHAGRFGVTSGQVTANATSFKGQAQAGVSADTNSHAYTAAITGKAETGVGVTASANHDFNRHVGGYVKGEAKAGASAYAEGVATVDPRTATAMVSGQVGAGATAGVYGTAGGHLGRLHGSVTGGAVAGAAAQAGGKFGIENGFLKTGANVNAAAGVGTHVQADAALDLRHHIKPGIAAGLRPGIAAATGAAVPGQTLQPEQSWIQRHLPW
ncbi:hypothetical protein [Melittangium boletus]|uniref:hypothetical protein n=1 Tax=Melittangium boletus TaxID=83453 RepID=UPI003DA2D091